MLSRILKLTRYIPGGHRHSDILNLYIFINIQDSLVSFMNYGLLGNLWQGIVFVTQLRCREQQSVLQQIIRNWSCSKCSHKTLVLKGILVSLWAERCTHLSFSLRNWWNILPNHHSHFSPLLKLICVNSDQNYVIVVHGQVCLWLWMIHGCI